MKPLALHSPSFVRVATPARSARFAQLARAGGLAICASVLLGGCSKSADAPAPTAAAPTSAYAAVARGKVDIEGGLLSLSMPREGTLAKVAVHEGDQVRQGQLLASLDTEPSLLAIDAAQAQLEQAQAQLKLLAVKQAAAKQRAQRLTAAVAAGAGDGQSADDAREAAAQIDAEQETDRASVSMANQKLAEARYELKQHSLVAPFDADVIEVSAQPGATVSPSSGPLFTLLPQKPRIVRAELNESFVGVIQPGMRAEVSANNDPSDNHWSAHVLRIGGVYGPATLENDPQVRANSRTVECVLAFDQPDSEQTRNLRIGQRVLVRFASANPKQPAAKD
ncbi:multidrug efflux pump subunit AcrA (membrane-fusion protein) [Rhodanobacter sp. ANJX3]|jgi:multidrug efflux pump subunit AcrA (membrane-fusion protein)|uniref:efflux RND transporter periplasmic adaptor subunit n=1 Tax=unclassified Rhodanobacter TaxID=2621553 RepID=UPI0015C8D29B|nr:MULTISPECIES: HlyD family efflux transporter periplasmic adaptor subunit [unclassified Rhodanobacter]MBB5358666.1 multidrug efflux pump subunit AcrA (membrane-fusion protein) [Rhodanobacter sp. ANJX3]NYE29413.1 multidrug efflux pump subunit AcrA (membrane-fusion protein) [Rhodanobacter sp. K2T2]